MTLALFTRPRLLAAIALGSALVTSLAGWLHPELAPTLLPVTALLATVLTLIVWKQKPGQLYKFVSTEAPASVEQAALEARLGYRADLLDLMTSSEPRSIILADKWERILFANREAARRVGRNSEELIGSTLASLVGTDQAAVMRRRLSEAFRIGAPLIHVDDNKASFSPRVTQTSYIPVDDTAHIRDAVLITESDITSVIAERDRREKMLRQVLDVCVAIVDRRDPHAAGHSALVGEVSRHVAALLNLSGVDGETAEIAGLLMNFGKVLVPQSILTKTSALTPEELSMVRHSMLSSADVLSIIQFDLPVVETLRQLHEHYDGTGLPEGRRNTDIIVSARICVAVNVFIALVSNRAHRRGKTSNEAIAILRRNEGTLYDPAVIDALEKFASKAEWTVRLEGLHSANVPYALDTATASA